MDYLLLPPVVLPTQAALMKVQDAVQPRTEGRKGGPLTASEEAQRWFQRLNSDETLSEKVVELPSLDETEDPIILRTKTPGSFAPTKGFTAVPLTFHGYLTTKKDALLLIESCIQGLLPYSKPPRLPIRSGSIFVYNPATAGSDFPENNVSWNICARENDFIIEHEMGRPDGLVKKTLQVPVSGGNFTVVAYYNASEVRKLCLSTPSRDPELRDISLRPELACQESTQNPTARERQSSMKTKVANCSPETLYQFKQNALIIFQGMIDDSQIEGLLKRTSKDWFPVFPSNKHWQDLCQEEFFHSTTPEELKIQMISLLETLYQISRHKMPSQLPHRGQISKDFSPSQNRRLFCEAFGVRYDGDLIKQRDTKQENLWLLRELDLIHNRDGLSLPPFVRYLSEYMSIKEFKIALTNITYKYTQISDFEKENYHAPLLLVECTILPTSRTSSTAKNLFRHWVSSQEGRDTCSQLLDNLRTSTSGPPLLFGLAALSSFQQMQSTVGPNELHRSSPNGLIAFDHFIHGQVPIGSVNSQVTLEDMVWSFLRATAHPTVFGFGFSRQILEPFVGPMTVPLSADQCTDTYWVLRLLYDLDHIDAMAKVRHNVSYHPSPALPPLNGLDNYDSVPLPRPKREEKSHYSFWDHWWCMAKNALCLKGVAEIELVEMAL